MTPVVNSDLPFVAVETGRFLVQMELMEDGLCVCVKRVELESVLGGTLVALLVSH